MGHICAVHSSLPNAAVYAEVTNSQIHSCWKCRDRHLRVHKTSTLNHRLMCCLHTAVDLHCFSSTPSNGSQTKPRTFGLQTVVSRKLKSRIIFQYSIDPHIHLGTDSTLAFAPETKRRWFSIRDIVYFWFSPASEASCLHVATNHSQS